MYQAVLTLSIVSIKFSLTWYIHQAFVMSHVSLISLAPMYSQDTLYTIESKTLLRTGTQTMAACEWVWCPVSLKETPLPVIRTDLVERGVLYQREATACFNTSYTVKSTWSDLDQCISFSKWQCIHLFGIDLSTGTWKSHLISLDPEDQPTLTGCTVSNQHDLSSNSINLIHPAWSGVPVCFDL